MSEEAWKDRAKFSGGPPTYQETAARDYYHPVFIDRDPEEDWTLRDHDGMDTDFEAEPPLIKATRVWDGVVVSRIG